MNDDSTNDGITDSDSNDATDSNFPITPDNSLGNNFYYHHDKATSKLFVQHAHYGDDPCKGQHDVLSKFYDACNKLNLVPDDTTLVHSGGSVSAKVIQQDDLPQRQLFASLPRQQIKHLLESYFVAQTRCTDADVDTDYRPYLMIDGKPAWLTREQWKSFSDYFTLLIGNHYCDETHTWQGKMEYLNTMVSDKDAPANNLPEWPGDDLDFDDEDESESWKNGVDEDE